MLGVLATDAALEVAAQAGLDLVEVAPDERPPVCRILDYGKFKYEQKRKQAKSQKTHQVQVKEIRLRPKTGDHDIDVKLRQARQFLSDKDKVKVNIEFKGREMAHIDLGREVLMDVIAKLEDVAKVERSPLMEGKKKMSAILAPKWLIAYVLSVESKVERERLTCISVPFAGGECRSLFSSQHAGMSGWDFFAANAGEVQRCTIIITRFQAACGRLFGLRDKLESSHSISPVLGASGGVGGIWNRIRENLDHCGVSSEISRFWLRAATCVKWLLILSFWNKRGRIVPKQKTHKGMKKRFKITARGKIKHKSAFRGHILSSKSAKRKRALRKGNVIVGAEAAIIRMGLAPGL
jgi:translation initiation factor IF-3